MSLGSNGSHHAAAARPPAAVAQFELALRLYGQARKMDAARCYVRALRLYPDFFEAAFNLGRLFQELGQTQEAIDCYRQVLRSNPSYAPAWGNLGAALYADGQFQEAIDCLRHACSIQSATPELLNNLGLALRARQQYLVAADCFRESLRHCPTDAEVHLNLGNTLRVQGQVNEAIVCLRHALELRPDFPEAHCDLAFALLLQGDFARGFFEYEWRWQRDGFVERQCAQPLWRGRDPAGRTLLVYTEQGAGDAIQFVRFVNVLAARGARVVLECQGSLVALFASVAGADEVIARGDPLPAFDWHVPLLSLPLRLGTTLSGLPATVPYLRVPGERSVPLPKPATAAADALKVGVVWRGNPRQTNDRLRSLPVALIEPLLSEPDMVFYSLQVEAAAGAWDAAKPSGLIDLSSLVHDYADTAALAQQLDLVLTVDTSVAHLAGALGRPVWLILPHAPDWRWLLGQERSPWYPTMRLFRQPAPGDWPGVIQAVGAALKAQRR